MRFHCDLIVSLTGSDQVCRTSPESEAKAPRSPPLRHTVFNQVAILSWRASILAVIVCASGRYTGAQQNVEHFYITLEQN